MFPWDFRELHVVPFSRSGLKPQPHSLALSLPYSWLHITFQACWFCLESFLTPVSPSLPFESSSVALKWTTSPLDPSYPGFPCFRSFHTFNSLCWPLRPSVLFYMETLQKPKESSADIPAASCTLSLSPIPSQTTQTCPESLSLSCAWRVVCAFFPFVTFLWRVSWSLLRLSSALSPIRAGDSGLLLSACT